MLRPILVILFVTLAELHSGDGVGPPPSINRYGSFGNRRFSSPPASAPTSAPQPALASPPPQRALPSTRSNRFSSVSIPEQQSSPGLTQSRSFNFPSPSSRGSGRFGSTGGVAKQPQSPQSASGADLPQNFPPIFLSSLSGGGGGPNGISDNTQWGPLIPNITPGTMLIRMDENGNPIDPIPEGYTPQSGYGTSDSSPDIISWMEREKQREEEEDPDSHKINTEGETIEQKLPSNGGDIVIKISGTNITQRKMNKIREFLKKSIDFVFQNTQFKSGLMARYM